MLHRLRLSDSDEGVTQGRFDDFQRAEGNSAVVLHPPAKVVSEFGLEDGLSRHVLAGGQADRAAELFDCLGRRLSLLCAPQGANQALGVLRGPQQVRRFH